MTEHYLKVWPAFFKPLLDGEKTFELRYNDRAYQKGDILVLQEYVPADGVTGAMYTGREARFEVVFLLSGWGLQNGYVCMQLKAAQAPIAIAGTPLAPSFE